VNTPSTANRHTQTIKGVTYVYEDYPYWDKHVYEDYPYWDKPRKQNRHRRVYLGKLGRDGSFIPNQKYLELKRDGAAASGERLLPGFTTA